MSDILCGMFIRGVLGRFYGLDFKKGNDRLRKLAMDTLDLYDEGKAADCKTKVKNTGPTRTLHD